MLQRLPFVLPEWTRVAWSSPAAQAVWAPRLARIATAWDAIERAAVADGVKPSTLQNVMPANLPEYTQRAAAAGLLAVPLGQVGAANRYSASGRPVVAGEPWAYRVALTRADLAADWGTAWSKGDDETIGRLLGFPPCCRAFFKTWWVDERWIDPTWPAAAAPYIYGGDQHEVTLAAGFAEANILGRWTGVRLVSHLPCSFSCGASIDIGKRMAAVGRLHGYTDEVDWIVEILSWPTQWTALHGIAEITTPVYRVSTRTDATAGRLVVQKHGTSYPREGASGNSFPFERRADVIPMTSLRSYTRAFEDPTEWTDNGFLSRETMELAHQVVASVAPAHVRTAIDLGCGNGRLLSLINADLRHGVEGDPARAERARERGLLVRDGNLLDLPERNALWASADRDCDLVLLMPGRLLEYPAKAEARRASLAGRQVLVYAYGDWLDRHGSLEQLTRAAGLSWRPIAQRADVLGVQAALLDLRDEATTRE